KPRLLRCVFFACRLLLPFGSLFCAGLSSLANPTPSFSRHRERVFSILALIMKPDRTRSRKPAVITNSRWLAYATAGAASVFTCTQSAEGTVHYSGTIGKFFGSNQDKSVRFQL